MSKIEDLVLAGIINNDEFARQVLPYVKDEYFSSRHTKTAYQLIEEYFAKYNKTPTTAALAIELEDIELDQDTYANTKTLIGELEVQPHVEYDWLTDQCERMCQERAVYNAIMSSIKILEDEGQHNKGQITKLLEDALAVSFDNQIGIDFTEEIERRFDLYHTTTDRIPLGIDLINKITHGGLPRKVLACLLGGTGVGKTLVMCHLAASHLIQGQNVLYITMEMAEERIAERIDANLMNVPVTDIVSLPRDVYMKKAEKIKATTAGRLFIKEYPTASAGAGHFRHLINELRQKKNFIPDVIYIDYINICSSHRIKSGSNVNSYSYIKAIAEELRGLAVETNTLLITATQTNRSGFTNSDPGLEDVSDSFGLPATADFMVGLITTEELEQSGRLMIKQLKNRFGDPSWHKRFVVGVDKSRMKLYDVEQNDVVAQIDDAPDVPTGRKRRGPDSAVFDQWK